MARPPPSLHSGDGGPAISAFLNYPADVAVDTSGNIFIADSLNHCIRKVDTDGIITTVAGIGGWGYFSGDGGPATEASLNSPQSVVVDSSGNIYIADAGNNRIRKVDASGIITTVANIGYYTSGIALDTSGNLYIAIRGKILKLNTDGIVTTVAGTGQFGYSGDGGPAIKAMLDWPSDVAVGASGSFYLVDYYKWRVRKVGFPLITAGLTGDGDITFAEGEGFTDIFESSGKHKRTNDLDTGVVLREFGYDENNNLIAITDQFGNQTIINYVAGVPTSIVSSDGLTTLLTIDANNHLTQITSPDGSYNTFEYTSDGLLTAKIEPEGNRFEHNFDNTGRLTDVNDEEGGHWNYNRTVDENGDITVVVTTGEGNVTTYLDHTESTGAFSSTITDPTGEQTLFNESGDGLSVSKSLPCGMGLDFKYDIDSEYMFKYIKEIKESTPSGLEKVTIRDKTYQDTDLDDIPDLITEMMTINGKATTLETNTLQSQRTITSPEGRTVTTLFDSPTLLTTNLAVPGLYETIYGYDARGRLTSISMGTRANTLSFNTQGFLESITDPESHTTTYTYDAVGHFTGINHPDGNSVRLTYDQNGNITVLTNPSDIDHSFGYNTVNRNNFYQTPLSGSYSYVYDKDRRLIQTNFPSGNQINNVYANGRLEQIQTPTLEGNIVFTYVCDTKVESITKSTESITYLYDGKLFTSENFSGSLNQSLVYSYNNEFNLSDFTYAEGTTNYSYDNDDLLIGAGSFTIARNTGNGLPEAVTSGAMNLTRNFNGYGEVEGQDFVINSQNLISWNLTRNNNGKITNKSESFDSTTSNYAYTYDSVGRLLTVTKNSALVEEYDYDANGSRIYEVNALRGISGRNFSYDDEDHMLTAGSTTYQYDLDGFLTTKTDGTDVTNYDYSSRGELLSVNLPDGRIIEYVHDPLGRRIAKMVDGLIVEKYLWHGLTRLLAVYDGSDNLVMRFEYADDRMPIAMTSGGATYYLTYDQVGSLKIVADASGNVVKMIDYDSFGYIISDSNPTFEVPFGFAGGLHDRDTGLVRFGYRDYYPDIGRWTAKDPILFAGGDTDLYGYCLSDPVNFVDPNGLYSILSEFNPFNPNSTLSRQARSIGAGMGGILAFALGDTATAKEAWNAAAQDSGQRILDENCAPTSAYVGYYGALGVSAAAATTALIGGVAEMAGLIDTAPQGNNIIRIISKPGKWGFRIDKAHHGQRWGHSKFWRW